MLPYDIFHAIFQWLNTRQPLLRLACSCRAFRDIIIPDLLFARVVFPPYSPNARLQSLCDIILTDGSVAGNAVRHLEVPTNLGPDLRWEAAIQKMPNLHTVFTYHVQGAFHHFSRIPRELISKTRLRRLRLYGCRPIDLDSLRDLGHLHEFVASFSSHTPYALTQQSALGEVLLRSRSTLVMLSLTSVIWHLDEPPPRPALLPDGEEMSWPRVSRVSIQADHHTSFDLPSYFPSARDISLNTGAWSTQLSNIPFISRLRSVDGTWSDIKAVVDAGATHLKRVVTRSYVLDEIDFPSCLPSTIRSLSFSSRSIRRDADELRELISSCPQLTFLSIAFKAAHLDHCNESLVGRFRLSDPPTLLTRFLLQDLILAHISGLPLKALQLAWINNDFRRVDYRGRLESFIITVSDLLPSLRVLSFAWATGVVYWTRTVVAEEGKALSYGRLREVPAEDGSDDLAWYDREYEAEQDEDTIDKNQQP